MTSESRRISDSVEIIEAKKSKERADYLWKTFIASVLGAVFAMMVWFVQREVTQRDEKEKATQALIKLVEGHERKMTLIEAKQIALEALINAKLIAAQAKFVDVMVLKNIEQQFSIFGAKGGVIPVKVLQKPITEELRRIELIKQKIGDIGTGPTFESE